MKLKQLTTDKYIKNSSLLFIFLMLANLLNFLYQIVMGRMISPGDYGTVNSMFSLITVVSLPVSIFQYLLAKKYSEVTVNNKYKEANELLTKCFIYCVIYSFCIVMISLLFYDEIAIWLNIQNSIIVLISLIVSILFIFYPLINGLLQGLQLFVSYGIVAILCSFFKLVFSLLLAGSRYLVFTNIISYGLALFTAIIYGVFILKRNNIIKISLLKPSNLNIELLTSSFIAQFLVLLLMNGDTLIIKALIKDQNIVGIFTSGMVLCKIPMFLTTSLTTVLFPTVAAEKETNNDTFMTLIKSMIVGTSIMMVAFVCILVIGPNIIQMLYGNNYAITREYLLFMSLYVISLSMISYIQNYFIAIGRTKIFNILMIIGMILCVVIFINININLQSILFIIAIIIITITVINMIYISKRWRKE